MVALGVLGLSACSAPDRDKLVGVGKECGHTLAPTDELKQKWATDLKTKARAEFEKEGLRGSALEERMAKVQWSALDRMDTVFGACAVAPLAYVYFYDVVFWDNEFSPDEMVGQTLPDGRRIVAHDEEKGFEVEASEEQVYVAELHPVVEEGATQRFGAVAVTLRPAGDALFGDVQADKVNVAGFAKGPLDRWAGAPFVSPNGQPVGELKDGVVVQGLAPFPLLGTLEGELLTVVPTRVRLPQTAIKLGPGSAVTYKGKTTKIKQFFTTTATIEGGATEWVKADTIDRTNKENANVKLVVLWLVLGATFFTLRMAFINLRGFAHAVAVTKGDYDDPDDPGEISHFQALSSALSATVGLGNIAGVALAVGAGGPGALFWMIIAGFLGMSSKFVECTLGQMYRHVDEDGVVSGGPMRYLDTGFAEKGFPRLGKFLSVMFALMCIGGSFGGGNMFQANQAYQAVAERFPSIAGDVGSAVFGVVLAILVGLVIIGGIKRIGAAASLVVPLMCGIYVVAAVAVLLLNFDKLPWAFATIVREAFTPEAGLGGMIGVLITGFQRAAFSNEAGVGSAAIAHSAAATDEPIREGIVAMMGPFIDTIVICTMTGLVVVITGVYKGGGGDGVLMTSEAFGQVFSWFPWVLAVAVLLFAFSTMISWSYYGERCFTLLFGKNTSLLYRIIFLFFVFFGSVFKLGNVLDFSDLMILGMAFPNVLGVVVLSGRVKTALAEYWARYKSGQMEPMGRKS